MLTSDKERKRNALRFAEYYDQQEVFDTLYAKSEAGAVFQDLIPLITSPENIKLAYRNIKTTMVVIHQVQMEKPSKIYPVFRKKHLYP